MKINDLFGIKKLKMDKLELEQEIKTLQGYVVDLKQQNDKLLQELNNAQANIQTLKSIIITQQDELNMRHAQEKAQEKYTDDSRYY